LRISVVRLGIAMLFVGAIFGVLGYISWNFLESAYLAQCMDLAAPSNCRSLASSAQDWAMILSASVIIFLTGIGFVIAGKKQIPGVNPR
jgi:hypothetical protein